MEKLKPCPFCGSDDIGIGKATTNFFEERFFVVCDNCGASSTKSKDAWRCVEAWNRRVKDDQDNVIKIPAADVRPVVRGTWIIHNELVKNELLDENEVYVCSACMYQKTKRKYNYCPNCGADMRGEENNDQENL